MYKIKELMIWFMLADGLSEVVGTRNSVVYLANPVFLLPRKIIMTVVMMNSTEAESVTPIVKTH